MENKMRENARRHFKNHKAQIRINSNDILIVEWRNENGSSEYYMQFIIDKKRGLLSLSGDVGCVVSCWYNPVKISDLIHYCQNIDYWMEKFQASTDIYTFNISDVMSDLEKIKQEYLDDSLDYGYSKEDIEDDFDSLKYELEYNWNPGGPFPESALDIIRKYDEDWWDCSSWTDLGKRVNPRLYDWSEGIKLAYEQIKDELGEA